MINRVPATVVFLSIISLTTTAHAANSEHVRQLLATKQCQNCDLSGAGLVLADLAGANLNGANLAGANLSRANLTGADLRNTNLTGVSLFGANLTGAKFSGANLLSADLRSSYLVGADFSDVNLNATNLQGAIGIPSQVATPEEFYALGVDAGAKGSQQQAVDYFNQAIATKPDYAGAYLARGIARYQMYDRQGAFVDAQIAEKLFTNQNNAEGIQLAQAFIQELKAPRTAKVNPGKPNFLEFLGGVTSLLLQFLPF